MNTSGANPEMEMAHVGGALTPVGRAQERGNTTMELTQDRLREQLEYSPETGEFTNRIDRLGSRGRVAKAGDKPGGVSVKGYLQIKICGRTHLAHRLAWLYVHGEFPSGQIDHRDGNRLNNRIENLRVCSPGENNENRGKGNGKCSSKHVGVCYCNYRKCWVASARRNGKAQYRYFKTEQEAIAGRAVLKASLHRFNPVQRVAI